MRRLGFAFFAFPSQTKANNPYSLTGQIPSFFITIETRLSRGGAAILS